MYIHERHTAIEEFKRKVATANAHGKIVNNHHNNLGPMDERSTLFYLHTKCTQCEKYVLVMSTSTFVRTLKN